jgi:ribosomal protein S18 acetylase RimI-like enzyme
VSIIFFRELKHEDFQDIVDISKGVWDDTDYLPGAFHTWVDEEGIILGGVDQAKNKVISIVRFSILSDKSGWIDGLRVHRDYRGQGIGKATTYKIFEAGKKALIEGRIERLGFSTVSDNIESIGIFKGLSFKVVEDQSHILAIKSYDDLDKHVNLKAYKLEPWKVSYESLLNNPYLLMRKGILPLAFVFQEFTKSLYNNLLHAKAFVKINGHPGIFIHKGGPNFLAFEETFEAIEDFTNYYLLKFGPETKEIYTPILNNLELIERLKAGSFIATDNWRPDYLYFLYESGL